MSLLILFLVFLLALAACYAVQTWFPFGDATIKNLICFAIVIIYIIWALGALGVSI